MDSAEYWDRYFNFSRESWNLQKF